MQRLEVSGAVRPIYGSLGVKRLICTKHFFTCVTTGFSLCINQSSHLWDIAQLTASFDVLLTAHLSIILATDLLNSSTCFEHYVIIIMRSKLYYTASGIITLCRRPSSAHLRTGQPPTVCDDTRCCIIKF